MSRRTRQKSIYDRIVVGSSPPPTGADPTSRCSLYALSCYTALYPAPSQGSLALLVIVGFVGVKLLGTLPRSAPARTLDGLYSVDELFENDRGVDVCRAEHHTERDAYSVPNNMALRALFPYPSDSLQSFRPPGAATLAESKEALSQSICSASPKRSKSLR